MARYPRLAAITRRWSPEHHIVQADHVFHDRITARVPLAGLAFVER
ncbi:hypothetical protein [Lentzea sp. NBRC 105346]|nr:hypothetical protein [Lentzea sp. NBRC 105346]